MRVQLGAVFAAGHSPREVENWTWGQLFEVSTSIQAYHADLAARLMHGKSPALEAARQPAPPDRSNYQSGWDPRKADKPTAVQLDRANQDTVNEFKRLEESQRGENSLISFKPAKEAAPDLFKEWARRRAVAMREAEEKLRS